MKYSPEQILLKLGSAGFDAFYVGGCVRDKLRGVKSDDVDVATNAKLTDIKKLF
ncbi:MAG: HD domain-containing protein, partial [Alphaproteobacteria bacterium]